MERNQSRQHGYKPKMFSDQDYPGFGGVPHGFSKGSSTNSNSTLRPYLGLPLPPIVGRRNSIVEKIGNTSFPSRRSSEDMSTVQQKSPFGIFSERDNPSVRHSGSDLSIAQNALQATTQYPKVPIRDFLNSSAEGGALNQNRISPVNLSHGNVEEARRAMETALKSRAPSIISISSTSSSVAEERAYLVDRLYQTCREASASYLRNLSPIPDRRNRYHPYNRNRRPGHQTLPGDVGRSRNLMDNISAICTYLWRVARSHPLTPRRMEAETVRVMRDLYVWGGLISKGAHKSNDVDNMGFAGGSSRGSVCSSVGRSAREDIGGAAIKLCEILGGGEALENCKGLVSELRPEGEEDGFEWV